MTIVMHFAWLTGVFEDDLFGQFFGALEKVHYFETTSNGDEEQALDRATHLFHNALMVLYYFNSLIMLIHISMVGMLAFCRTWITAPVKYLYS